MLVFATWELYRDSNLMCLRCITGTCCCIHTPMLLHFSLSPKALVMQDCEYGGLLSRIKM
ncbi:unnamed protein product [Lupinus luteus]|uniref:Uncharacterized protein n=1 Tax=Lupinus luteus TaxID=3873 RepID=A0AAV1XPJ7_LUPLU